MVETELEKVMLKFMHHEADILVATTIIENGLDIPLCNTILINRAERLGRVARVADNRFFLPETLAQLAEIARELADGSPAGAFTAAAFKDRSGVGRNLTIQILEYLDKMGATRRQGDARILLRGGDVFG